MVEIMEKVGFKESCPACEAWLHSCVHCRFYIDLRCTETAADRVSDPEALNYCDWFMVVQDDGGSPGDKGTRSEAEDMWKKLTRK
jgi:hypothetical protein